VKRLFDIAVSAIALLVLLPLIGAIALIVRIKLGKPILFRQIRPGLGGRPFTIIKFRTMLDARDNSGREVADGERLTSFGKALRASSLDELPELWNVLCGDMSLVGPRPLLIEYLPLYTTEQARRHEVRPGLTGWAQINGRNALTWNEKFALDVWYVEHHNARLDMTILWRTLARVLDRHGISADGEATMPRFEGSRE
jgi:lipopolysaccharide/colanic/teichoic acid biosynthesis glycosyltransferase